MLVTSFAPLWLSVLFILGWDIYSVRYSKLYCLLKDKSVQLAFSLVVALMLLISTIMVLRFVFNKSKANEHSGYGKIISARKSTTLVTDFLLTYIMPLIAFDFLSLRDIVLFLIYFALIAFLNIRNGNVYTNILFEFMGYKIYSCDIERNITGKQFPIMDCTVISKDNLTGIVGQEFPFFDFDNNIYLNLRKG